MVAPSSACSSLATPPVLVFAALQRHPPPRRSSACEENTQLIHSSFSLNIAQPYSYTLKPRPTSQHTPRLLHHPRSTHFQLPLPLHTCKHTITSCRCYERHHHIHRTLYPYRCLVNIRLRSIVVRWSRHRQLAPALLHHPSLCLLLSNAVLRDTPVSAKKTHN